MSIDEGGGVVAKTCQVVREISRSGVRGARLVDLAARTGLARPSVHRILRTLCNENFVFQTSARRYRLTSLVHEIGLSAPSPAGNVELLRPVIQSLSDLCEDTVYLSMRSGDQAYYLMRGEGAFPIRTLVVNPHRTLHLVSCQSGRALLAGMDEREADAIIEKAWKYDRSLFNAATMQSLREEVAFVRENGYGWCRDVTFEGISGLTRPVPNPSGPAYLAVTISAITPRLSFERVRELLPDLTRTVNHIREVIDSLSG